MPDLPSSSSFIPKRTAGTKIRQKRTRNFFLLSILSYACLIAAPTASAAVYVYQIYAERQFNQMVTRLDEAIGGFSEAEMARVLEFDQRLKFSQHLVDSHISVVKALTALEEATARNAGFRSLAIKRLNEETLSVEGELVTTDFDVALFQRGIYKNTEEIPVQSAILNEVAFVPPTEDGGIDIVTLKGAFTFSSSDIAFTVNGGDDTAEATPADATDSTVTENADDTTDTTSVDVPSDAGEASAVIDESL
ncbi:MAG: hypothetical protein RLZZ360_762 [Candidatus Parcubacteria bacterium]|jgi:hypothetical protein